MKYTVLMVMSASTDASVDGSAVSEPDESRKRPRSLAHFTGSALHATSGLRIPCGRPSCPAVVDNNRSRRDAMDTA